MHSEVEPKKEIKRLESGCGARRFGGVPLVRHSELRRNGLGVPGAERGRCTAHPGGVLRGIPYIGSEEIVPSVAVLAEKEFAW